MTVANINTIFFIFCSKNLFMVQNNKITGKRDVPFFHKFLPKYKKNSITDTKMPVMLNVNPVAGLCFNVWPQPRGR